MTWEEFVKGVTILYAFGLATKDDWELRIWYRALEGEMGSDEYERSCLHLCKHNTKFWETDNIPAQLMEVAAKFKMERGAKLIAARIESDKQRRERERQEAIDSWGSDEERLKAVEKIKVLNRKIFK